MRIVILFGILVLSVAHPLPVKAADTPDLRLRLFNVIPDVCFQTARGKPPTPETAKRMMLEVADNVPPTVRTHFSRIPTWFRLMSQPDEVFIGVGDSPGACHVILANTKQTVAVRETVSALLKTGGFQAIRQNTVADSDIDMLFVSKAPDGYMLVSLQAPRDVVHEGIGDQGAVHIKLMPAAMFEKLLSKR